MNDIALASKKGRRTLYTYFKSKDEIYLAVVESELDILSDMMKRVADKDISPDKKIIEMIYTRLDEPFVLIFLEIFGVWKKFGSALMQKKCNCLKAC